ncbi:MAG: hypothetical protein ACFCBV_02305 [Phycisphaerales bacterium]
MFENFRLQRTQSLMLTAFSTWLLVFSLGLAIPSQPLRDIVVVSIFNLRDGEAFEKYEEDARKRKLMQESARTQGQDNEQQVEEVQSANDSPGEPAKPSNAEATADPGPARPLRGMTWCWLPVLLVAIALTSTPTNLVLLCVSGALIGASCIRMVQNGLPATRNASRSGSMDSDDGDLDSETDSVSSDDAESTDIDSDRDVPVITAVVNGLSVYLAIAAGLIVVQGNVVFDTTIPDLYIRLASAATLFSIVAGTNRFFVHDLIRTVSPFGGARSRSRD